MLTLHDALRAILPRSVAIPILSGPARGLPWYPRTSDVTAYWRGTYEREEVGSGSIYTVTHGLGYEPG